MKIQKPDLVKPTTLENASFLQKVSVIQAWPSSPPNPSEQATKTNWLNFPPNHQTIPSLSQPHHQTSSEDKDYSKNIEM